MPLHLPQLERHLRAGGSRLVATGDPADDAMDLVANSAEADAGERGHATV